MTMAVWSGVNTQIMSDTVNINSAARHIDLENLNKINSQRT